MASFKHSKSTFNTLCLILIILCFFTTTHAQLYKDYYKKTCPSFGKIVSNIVKDAVSNEPRMGASLLRLHFHDCFVNGCDGSVLLDDFGGEKGSVHNVNSLRGFEVIDTIKAQVEEKCPGIVSCADILALTAKQSVVELGGPSWTVLLGRKDSVTGGSASLADNQLPFATDNLDNLITLFSNNGFSIKELVVLSGAHTIGEARCVRFRDHIYGDQNIDTSFAQSLQQICPPNPGFGDGNLAPLDTQTPRKFDNSYFVNLINFKGLLHSDQVLFNGDQTDSIVQNYANDVNAFYSDFKEAMVKMSQLNVITGFDGIIRTNCRSSS